MSISKKAINGILIIFMIVIWSFVGLRVFGLSSMNDSNTVLAGPIFKDSLVATKKKFKRVEIERNPFKLYRRPKTIKISLNKPSKKQVPKVKEVTKKPNSDFIWPKLFYYGFVGSDEEKGRLAVIKLDNKLVRIRLGQNINSELILRSIHRDSIIISANNEQKIIRRNR